MSQPGAEINSIVPGMMLIVREKLCGRRWPPESRAVLDASSIAVLSARLLLDLSPAAFKTRHLEEELVRTGLRMLYSVHQDRYVMVTGSSSEPLVAEASAQIMNYRVGTNPNQQAYMDVWGLLGDYVDQGLLPQGTIGELIGRVLSILAMDNAIDALSEHCQLKYQTPVTVAAYYKALLTDAAWETLHRSTPANRTQLSSVSATKTFEDAFADAYLHFSHYAKANDANPMQDRFAWALWLRGTAILCQLNQELSDRATPIFFSKLGNLSPRSMSMVLDQDKTSPSADPLTIEIQSAERLSLHSQGNKPPYIAAVHCYALTKDEGLRVTTPSAHNLRNPESDAEAPRYQIDFRGLAAYRNLTEPTKIDIRRMIDGSKNALFKNHPRNYGLPILRRMLPVLQGDPDATAWFGGLESAGPLLQEGSGNISKGKGREHAQGGDRPLSTGKAKEPREGEATGPRRSMLARSWDTLIGKDAPSHGSSQRRRSSRLAGQRQPEENPWPGHS